MFDRIPDATLLLDARQMRFVAANPAALAMLRCSAEQLSHLHPSHISPEHQPDGLPSRAKAEEMIRRAVEAGCHRFEWVHCSPGRPAGFPVEVTLTALEAEPAPMLQVTWRELTETKRLELALERAQRRESLAVVAGGLTQHLNNLVTGIGLHLALVQERRRAEPTLDADLAGVDAGLARIAELSRQLQACVGPRALSRRPLELAGLVRDVVRSPGFARRCVSNLPSRLEIVGDEVQLRLLVHNLVTNAVEATEGGAGAVHVRLSRQGAQHVLLEVVDHGCGIPETLLSRVSEPFFSTRPAALGLGLTAVQAITDAHRGALRITSVAGAGTTCAVSLPCGAVGLDERVVMPGLSPRRGGPVLVVDDEEPVRRGAGLMLRRLGLSVVEAADGEDALRAFTAHRGEIAWVLTDLSMPKVSGVELVRRLRALDAQLPVVVTSGWSEGQVADQFGDTLPTAVLAKPYTRDALVQLLRRFGLWSD